MAGEEASDVDVPLARQWRRHRHPYFFFCFAPKSIMRKFVLRGRVRNLDASNRHHLPVPRAVALFCPCANVVCVRRCLGAAAAMAMALMESPLLLVFHRHAGRRGLRDRVARGAQPAMP